MLQVIQYQKTGDITVEELPVPQLKDGGVVIRNAYSLISAGTERSSVETAQATLLGKARSRPDLVRQVIDNYKRQGLLATYEKVKNRLDNYKDLGYSSAGVVVQSACEDLAVGDRVACGGVGYAAHAEFIFVPRNLVVRVPDEVTLSEASFTTVGAIALQGVRQGDVHLGERVVVVGLGLVGLLTVQILKANGCEVLGLDISARNFRIARELGCDQVALSRREALPAIDMFTGGHGADAVIITAATTSSAPVELAAQCARKKARVVVVGAVGMDVPRSPAHDKELEFRMSCSYGPGRYDPEYELYGHDYPPAYVRWTENRNMQAVLSLIAQKKLVLQSLVTHTFEIGDALKAYAVILGNTSEPFVGVLIAYPRKDNIEPIKTLDLRGSRPRKDGACKVGVIGPGNHTQSYLLPHLQEAGAQLEVVAASKPINAKSAGKKFNFGSCTTESAHVLGDTNINLVVIGTRHDTHARFVIEALRAGKHVFVEKPLATTPEELEEILTTYNKVAGSMLMVGYNRRFSPPIRALQEFFATTLEPLAITYRVNAGFIPKSNWYQDPAQGGRVVGEIGHFVDTLQFLASAPITSVYATAPEDPGNRYCHDNMLISFTFRNGSVGQIQYLANGSSAMPKEYIEVFGGGKSAVMNNFKQMTLFDERRSRSKRFDGGKGHREEMRAVVEAVRSGQEPISVESLITSSRASFAILASLKSRSIVSLPA